MIREPLIFAAIPDLCGKIKGKAFPLAQLDRAAVGGLGWTPTNTQINCFDNIGSTPFGAFGDVALVPDPAAAAIVDFGDGSVPERFVLSDIRTMEGDPWTCCTRGMLRGALARLKAVSGLTLKGAFEHEFQLAGPAPHPGWAYALAGFRQQAAFCETLMAALGVAGLKPDTMVKEYGDNQYEATIGPEEGIRIADAAVMLRELARATARRMGEHVTFTPIRDPKGVGNGVHIHMSFVDAEGRPATWDANGPSGMSPVTGSFIAGILRHINSIVAFTAPSAVSYLRLTPHRWSAAYNNLGYRDREAAIRICGLAGKDAAATARSYNFEYRAADAAASPHLALAALVHAGAQGIEDGLPPPEVTGEDLALLEPAALAARGYERLPADLPAALDRLEGDALVRGWFPEGFAEIYVAHKRGELAWLNGKSPEEILAAYEAVY
ncbi:MAG: glutamine synthetase [Cereibacter sphaeroides]|uniref:Glutamine synthetase n=1 Tax=Cereibacter sphaeroides TaxID=1063 RepID=A0A2W5TYS8_CERSP|nr:MAG: glutamine synthetase [Cereibacter sphaeroides]